jgi:hypothetical protein
MWTRLQFTPTQQAKARRSGSKAWWPPHFACALCGRATRTQGLGDKRRALAQIEEVLAAKVMASRQQQAKQQPQQPAGSKSR